jgi:hypothetical protein
MTAPDITTRLRTMSGMLQMGERIAYGSDAALMSAAADEIASLRAQLEAAQADAERWHFVRDHATVSVDEYVWITTSSGHRIHVTSACAGAEAEQLIDASIVIHKARGVKP